MAARTLASRRAQLNNRLLYGPFRNERSREEVVNLRHGTLRQPKLNPGVDADSPLGRMLEEFATIRTDLRFREDGIHTTLTFKRNGK